MAAAAGSARPGAALLLGGKNKGLVFSGLRPLLEEKGLALYYFGEAGPEVQRMIGLSGGIFPGVGEALTAAFAAQRGSTAAQGILAPGGTSYDQFKDFEERGRFVKEFVVRLRGSTGHDRKRPDLAIFALTLVLVVLGILMVFNTSTAAGERVYGSQSGFLVRQAVSALSALFLCRVVCSFPTANWSPMYRCSSSAVCSCLCSSYPGHRPRSQQRPPLARVGAAAHPAFGVWQVGGHPLSFHDSGQETATGVDGILPRLHPAPLILLVFSDWFLST